MSFPDWVIAKVVKLEARLQRIEQALGPLIERGVYECGPEERWVLEVGRKKEDDRG